MLWFSFAGLRHESDWHTPTLRAARAERVAGIEPALSAWKAEVLPLNYTRLHPPKSSVDSSPKGNVKCPNLKFPFVSSACTANLARPRRMVQGVGFEPTKAVPSDLQSDPFGRSGTPASKRDELSRFATRSVKQKLWDVVGCRRDLTVCDYPSSVAVAKLDDNG